MNTEPNFVFANADYDQERIETASRLGEAQSIQRPDFVFVNFDCDEDEHQKRTSRKVVRSQATAYSHRVAPRGTAKQEVALRRLRSAEDSSNGPSRRPSVTSTLSSTTSTSGKRRRGSPLHQQHTSLVAGTANISRKRAALPVRRGRARASSIQSNRSSRSLSPGAFEYALPDPAFLDASMRDPFDTQPVRHRDWYGKLISFWYNVVFARSIRVLKATKSELDEYTIWSRRQELQEPALFYSALFLASGIPVAEGLFPVEAALWLRYKTVEAMKEAVADPERSLSTPVILAVGRIALHEHIYGNRQLAHGVHRPVQKRMISLRGGLANMGLPNTTVQLIVWTDALLSAEAGTEPYFADVPRQLAIRSYSAQEAMHVTNHCSPKRLEHPGYGKGAETPEYSAYNDQTG
ncbi:Hypothetical predicted protein [Lecanosticta acicola]|uniref:Uncharacterized protein n=1 Tax=Lecanosticta acicola TaxID=111012 RepID=A0AAI8Z4X1_9PEZI|nr:Hypothetical predicted protein [Lecanosticta acicola]